MKITVTYDNSKTFVYKVKPRHLVAYEDTFGSLNETARDMFQLAHLASGDPRDFKEWLDDVDEITPEEQPDAAGQPTGPGGDPVPTVKPSRPSRSRSA
jgi:hypothetical protein